MNCNSTSLWGFLFSFMIVTLFFNSHCTLVSDIFHRELRFFYFITTLGPSVAQPTSFAFVDRECLYFHIASSRYQERCAGPWLEMEGWGGVAINFADRRAWFWVWLFLDSFSFLTATSSSSVHRGTLKTFHVVKRNVCSLIFSYFRSLWIL